MRVVLDFNAFVDGGGLKKKLSTLIFNPCFHCVVLYRVSSLLYRNHLEPLAKIVWYINRNKYNADIDYRADLAGGFVLKHGLGTVIGGSVVSKGRLTVYQGVTLGNDYKPPKMNPDGVMTTMPYIYSDVVIYSNAIVVGSITIESGVVIKAGQIVYKDIFKDN